MFVTAASSNHFLTVIQFIVSLQGAPVIFYDIGLTESEAEEIKRMPVEYRLFDWSSVPSWGLITAPSAGSYVWKPVIIHTVFQENHEIVIWCDAGNIIEDRNALEQYVRQIHLYTPISHGTIRTWTHDSCLKHMNIPTEHLQYSMCNAAIIGFVVNDPVVKEFVDEWKQCSLREELIVGSRENHRHDQSILSCLFYKYNRVCSPFLIGCSIHNDSNVNMYKSQIGQDKWVQSVLGNKPNGFFIELGATDGVVLSNTYFFEKVLGWNGICIEPNPSFHSALTRNRSCNISKFCVSDKDDETLDFAICGHTSGAMITAGPFTKSNHIIKVATKTLRSILQLYSAPTTIDYLSLDVEGHEYEVMRHFPFNEYIIQCITVEHNEPHTGPEMRMKIRKLLEENGYVFVKGNDDVHNWRHGPIDDFYIHHTVVRPMQTSFPGVAPVLGETPLSPVVPGVL